MTGGPYKTTLAHLVALARLVGRGEENASALAVGAGVPWATLAGALSSMVDAGLVERRCEAGSPAELGRPLRTYYTATQRGADHLAAWCVRLDPGAQDCAQT